VSPDQKKQQQMVGEKKTKKTRRRRENLEILTFQDSDFILFLFLFLFFGGREVGRCGHKKMEPRFQLLKKKTVAHALALARHSHFWQTAQAKQMTLKTGDGIREAEHNQAAATVLTLKW
jgi:hypothetical protein